MSYVEDSRWKRAENPEDKFHGMTLMAFVEEGHRKRAENPEEFEKTYPLDERMIQMAAMKFAVILSANASLKVSPCEFNMQEITLMKISGLPRFMLNCPSWGKKTPCETNATVYMAPETNGGATLSLEASMRADVWAMGVVLFKMATGAFYTPSMTEAEVEARFASGIPLSAPAKACILQMLNADPLLRPNANALLSGNSWVIIDLPQRSPPPASAIVRQALENGQFVLPASTPTLAGAKGGIRRPIWPADKKPEAITNETTFNGYVWTD